jgi:spermidine synthase
MKRDNWLNKGKSYLSEIHLETVPSKFSKQLHVSLVKGRLQLYTDEVIYSWEDLYRNFRTAIRRLNWAKFKPESVLILGLGLGSVIQIIEKQSKRPMTITAVEIDEHVLYLVKKYSAAKFRSPVEYICGDAHSFIIQNKRKYDLILFDIFIDDLIPTQFLTLSFAKKLAQSLTESGIILFNRIAMEPDQIMASMEYFDQVYSKVFPSSVILEVRTNWILLSNKHQLKT